MTRRCAKCLSRLFGKKGHGWVADKIVLCAECMFPNKKKKRDG